MIETMESTNVAAKFVFRDDRKYCNIPGTKIVSIKDQVLISSGVLSLDSLIGGGLPLGSIFLIEEDEFGVFSKYLAKYFLAEGVACKQCLYVASIDCDTRQLVQDLPSPVEYSETSRASDRDPENLKIAWRYRDSPMVQSSPSVSGAPVFGHNFDLTCPYKKEVLDNAEITHWPSHLGGHPYSALLSDLYNHIQKQGHSVSLAQPRRTVLRIVLHSLGSPLWPLDQHLPRFLLALRHMMQSAFACVLITMTTDMLEPAVVEQCEHLSDSVIRLQSLANNSSPAYSEYNGLLSVIKLPNLHTLTSHTPDTLDWAFKLRKRRFVVEKLHLPPELQETTQREQDDITSSASVLSCATSGGRGKALDF